MALLLLGLLGLLGLWVLLRAHTRGPRLAPRWPPGPRPLPLVGNLHLLRVCQQERSLMELSEQYGPVFTIHLGGQKTVVLTGYKAVREALVGTGQELADRPPIPIFQLIQGGRGRFVMGRGPPGGEGQSPALLFGGGTGCPCGGGAVHGDPAHRGDGASPGRRRDSERLLWGRPVAYRHLLLLGASLESARQLAVRTLHGLGVGRGPVADKVLQELRCLVGQLDQYGGRPFPLALLGWAPSNVTFTLLFGQRFDYQDPVFVSLLGLIDDVMVLLGTPGLQLFNIYPRLGALLQLHRPVLRKIDEVRAILRALLEARRPPAPGGGPVHSYVDALRQQGQVWASPPPLPRSRGHPGPTWSCPRSSPTAWGLPEPRGSWEDGWAPPAGAQGSRRCPSAKPGFCPFSGARGAASVEPCPPALQGGDPDGLFSEANVVACVLDMVMAGTETTAATLQWAALLMGRHPSVQGGCAAAPLPTPAPGAQGRGPQGHGCPLLPADRVQEELDRVLGPGRPPQPADQRALPYTNAVLHEVQRFITLLPHVPRCTAGSTRLGGYLLPKGTPVVPLLSSVLLDKTQWETPDQFNPGHFLDADGHFVKREAFLPFLRCGCGASRVSGGDLGSFRLQPPPGLGPAGLRTVPTPAFTMRPPAQVLCAVPRPQGR
ncbi:hypothetical protein QTO34_016420 [Cnephaeus nilssonii]|uniref:Cytochrome P450 2W1 n=1 Tax=Cnephaeus nilssonii TaxID=3371016 RepID=A0AA40I6W3_CNENI|nr:hypothetical protein QTO34_016420 [Eptesicus nilssonii]